MFHHFFEKHINEEKIKRDRLKRDQVISNIDSIFLKFTKQEKNFPDPFTLREMQKWITALAKKGVVY